MKRAFWFPLFLIMAMSCLDEPDCYRQNLNILGITFKKMYDGTGDTVNIWKAYADGFEDSLFYNSEGVTSLALPLNYLKTETSFTIEGVERTFQLFLTHQSKTQFVSEDCGSRFIVSDLVISSSTFDSVKVVSNSLSNPAHVNIIVYRCPRTNIMRFSFRQLYMDTVSQGRADVHQVNSVTADFAPGPLWENVSLSSILLPVNPDALSSTFNFDLDDNDMRTFTVDYQKTETEVLTKCGVQKFFSHLTLSNNDFNMVEVAADSIHDPPYTNIVSYRCPTTNNIKVLFKKSSGSSKVNDTLKVVTLTDDFSGASLYADTLVSNVILSLNPNATTTTYTFAQEGSVTNTITVKYTATPTTFHERCGEQIVFTDLEIVNTDFTQDGADISDPKAKFPVVNNIEILR
jgi:hypothetical protein